MWISKSLLFREQAANNQCTVSESMFTGWLSTKVKHIKRTSQP